ncbi:PepSY domain-containing protein [Cohnella cellulosilytica]|uniref:PepSY domain-containing protein n=1 Tax=Cohnella cellulosilytica TaxID=986710 RepID=A0ABW2FQD9_9BACL
MTKRTLRLAAYIAIPLAGIVIAAALWRPWAEQPEPVSREALQEAVLSRYPGTVKNLVKAEDQYVLLLETDQGLYRVKADAVSGEIVYLERLQTADQDNKPAPTPPSESSSPPPSPNVPPSTASPGENAGKPLPFIGVERAKKIAAVHVQGTAEDAELKGSAAGNAYYLVEVDVEGGRDADVQVNAVSGEVMSVIWDDENDKDRKDDKDD